MVAVIQANRAGILVILGRYDEAIAAADASLAREGNLTTAHSIAWYSIKAMHFDLLGGLTKPKVHLHKRMSLIRACIPPDLTVSHANTVTNANKSPVPWFNGSTGSCSRFTYLWFFPSE